MACKKTSTCNVLLPLFALIFLACTCGAQGKPGENSSYPKLFRFGVLGVLPAINQRDAQIAIEMNFVRRNRDQFPGIKAKLDFLTDVDSTVDKFNSSQLHGLSTTGIDYMSLKDRIDINPLFIATRVEKPLENYLLITSSEISNLEQLSSLPNRRLLTEDFGVRNMGLVWLDTVLMEKEEILSTTFFTSIKKVFKPSRMVLPVFFRQAEACLVPESAFQTMVELNPQIGKKLNIILRSPGFVRSVHCAHPSLSKKFVDAMISNAMKMPESTDGQQLMMIFQFRKHYLFKSEYLFETERIHMLHKEMKGR